MKGSKQKCENYRTISLISHSSKIMLNIILNRLKHYTEDFISEEQDGFRTGRSTSEQIFNLRVISENILSIVNHYINFSLISKKRLIEYGTTRYGQQ